MYDRSIVQLDMELDRNCLSVTVLYLLSKSVCD